eukprot:CFRG3362T1
MTVNAPVKIIGFGNPLLDISANVTEDFLKKYELEDNNAILAEDKHLPMYEELRKFNAEYIPGGATQNTIRVTQWILQDKHTCSMVGCVGVDEYAQIMETRAEESGVNVAYMKDESTATGTCAVCITGHSRSLVANLGAANNYAEEHLKKKEIWDLVEAAQIGYISGFFLTVSPPTIQAVAKHFSKSNKIFCMNLSAPFLCQFFKDPQAAALPYTDIVFGNESEALAYSEANALGLTDISEIALSIAALPKDNERSRMVVITQGSDATIIARDGKITTYAVEKLPAEKIIDTNAAGDAFVAGFLAQMSKGQSVDESVRCGHWAAQLIIQHSGCTYPDTPDFK